MTKELITPRVILTGNGVTKVFPFNFPVISAEHLLFRRMLDNGNMEVVTPGTYSYEISASGGNVVFVSAPAYLQRFELTRQTPESQLVSVSSTNAYDPKVVEGVWDKLTMIAQDHRERLSRVIMRPENMTDEEALTLLNSTVGEVQAILAEAEALVGSALYLQRRTVTLASGQLIYPNADDTTALGLTASNHFLIGATGSRALVYGEDYTVTTSGALQLDSSFAPVTGEVLLVVQMPRVTNEEAQAILDEYEDRVRAHADAAQAAAASTFGPKEDATRDLAFFQTTFDGDGLTQGSTTGLSVEPAEASFGKCLKFTQSATTGYIAQRSLNLGAGRVYRVRARVKLVSQSLNTDTTFRLYCWPVGEDFLRKASGQGASSTVSVGTIVELDETFAAVAGPGVSAVQSAIASWPYIRFGVHCTTPAGSSCQWVMERLIVDDVTNIVAQKATTYIGAGDNYPLISLYSGEMYNNGVSDVPRVPTQGLVNVKDGNGVVHLAMWPDLQGDGDYDADWWYNGNAYHNVMAGFEMIFGSAVTPNGPSDGNRGRIRFGCTGNFAGRGTTNVNVIQSGVDYDGNTINHLAIGPYKSSAFWTYWDKTTGHMGVGTTDVRARLHVVSGGSQPALLESTGATSRLAFRGSAQTDDTTAMIGIDSSGRLVGRGAGVDIFKLGSTGMQAGSDNSVSCGTVPFRWSFVAAVTGTINTSDEREKQDIEEIPDEWLDAWADVQWCRYRWKDAVAEKGDGARWHTGLIAQRVRDAFAARGLDAMEIGILCFDEWEDEETGEKRDRYGVRYEEAFALEAALMRRRMDRLEKSA